MKKETYANYVRQDLISYLNSFHRIALRNSAVYHNGNYAYNGINLDQMAAPSYNDVSTTPGHSNDIKVGLSASLVDTVTSIITAIPPEIQTKSLTKNSFDYFKATELEDTFDYYLNQEDVYKKAAVVVRNAGVYGKSALWYNQFTDKVQVINPWQYQMLNNEIINPKYALIRFQYFSVNWLDDWGLTKEINKIYRDLGNLRFLDLQFLYSQFDKLIYVYFQDTLIKQVPYNGIKIPIDELYYKDPLDGGRSVGLVDESYASQDVAAYLTNCIKDHAEDAWQPTIITKNSIGFKHVSINTNTGNVYNVISANGDESNSPVDVFAPNFTNDQFISVTEWLKSSQYQLSGVNLSTASGQLQDGVNSAELQYSLNDLQNQRLQSFLRNYLNLFKDHLKSVILNKPAEAIINQNVSDITWGELADNVEQWNVKFVVSDNRNLKLNYGQITSDLKDLGMITPREYSELIIDQNIDRLKQIIRKTRSTCYSFIRKKLNGEEPVIRPWTPVLPLLKIILEVASDLEQINADENILQTLTDLYLQVNEVAQNLQQLPAAKEAV